MEVVASLSQSRTAAAQCGLFTHKSVPVIFEPPCINTVPKILLSILCASVLKNDNIFGCVWHFQIQTSNAYDFLL